VTDKGGRPTDYNEDVAALFCSRIAVGASLRSVCAMDDMPSHQTIYNWFAKWPAFVEHYARAKSDSADSRVDQIEDIADKVLSGEYDPQAARVAIDAFKWTSGKHRPKKYGDKITTEHTGGITLTDVSDEELDRKLQSLINAAGIIK